MAGIAIPGLAATALPAQLPQPAPQPHTPHPALHAPVPTTAVIVPDDEASVAGLEARVGAQTALAIIGAAPTSLEDLGKYSDVSGTFANGARVTAQLTLAVHHIAVAQGRTTTVHTLRSNASDFKPAATAEVMPNIQVVFEALELYARAPVARGYATARDMAAFVHAIREFVRLDLSTLPEASQISAVSDIIPALQQLIANKQAHFGAPASYQPILARVARRAHESALTERLRAASNAFGTQYSMAITRIVNPGAAL